MKEDLWNGILHKSASSLPAAGDSWEDTSCSASQSWDAVTWPSPDEAGPELRLDAYCADEPDGAVLRHNGQLDAAAAEINS